MYTCSSTIEHQHTNKKQKRKHLVLGNINEICVKLYKTMIEVKFTDGKEMNKRGHKLTMCFHKTGNSD